MKEPLDIVLLEDSVDDAALVERALREGGIAFSLQRVETREDFLRALELPPDLVLADFSLPHFDGRSALKLARAAQRPVPVIIVTGTLVDEDAVELLRDSAADYILKDRLSRLAPAVRRVIADAELARQRESIERALQRSELRYRRLFESALDGMLILDGETGAIVDINPYLTALLGYACEEVVGKRVAEIGAMKDVEAAGRVFAELQKSDYVRYEHIPLVSKAGVAIDVEVIANAYLVEGKRFIQCNIRDTRERAAAERLLHEQLDELRRFQSVTVDRELRLQELEQRLAGLTAMPHKAP